MASQDKSTEDFEITIGQGIIYLICKENRKM
jgi:hypothetical protein